jgi:hypothetical protein
MSDEIANVKNATLKLNLKSDKGYSSKVECKVNAWQWRAIDLIIESKEFTEQDLVKITNELE